MLFGYGLAVNSPPWDFGKLLGVYVTLFFLGVRPDLPISVGDALIGRGGLVITFWRA